MAKWQWLWIFIDAIDSITDDNGNDNGGTCLLFMTFFSLFRSKPLKGWGETLK